YYSETFFHRRENPYQECRRNSGHQSKPQSQACPPDWPCCAMRRPALVISKLTAEAIMMVRRDQRPQVRTMPIEPLSATAFHSGGRSREMTHDNVPTTVDSLASGSNSPVHVRVRFQSAHDGHGAAGDCRKIADLDRG